MFSRSFIFQSFLQSCPRGSFQLLYFYSRPSSPRSFSSQAARYANSIANRVASQPKSSARLKIPDANEETLKFAGRRPEGLGKLERKVAKLGSVVLYEAPSHRGYIFGAYSIGAFAFSYAVYNSHITFRDPRARLPMWLQTLVGGICVIMSILGTIFVARASRLIKAVTAVHLNGAMYLRFSIRRMLPFRKPWQIDVLPRQVAFSRQLVVDPARVTPEGQVTASGQKSVSEISFFRAPFKKLNYLFFRFFQSVRQIFTQEDFILVEVQGQKGAFRMDANGFVSNDLLLVGNPVAVKYK
ncbi:hypothetical protein VTN77DRAFT_1057 [Rasamsonia byssochlamydoides]|uniref:uncharacterized protein n=1 Tax=Rasamsonia byssochlamydoides TaxID=89139 RepID=UPI0037428FED